jgi:hypothetical protein
MTGLMTDAGAFWYSIILGYDCPNGRAPGLFLELARNHGSDASSMENLHESNRNP